MKLGWQMASKPRTLAAAAAILVSLALRAPAHSQIIGSYDNFDSINDTGREAEGFEIDVEDVQPADVTRIFPDNFPAGQPYIRYATPNKNALRLITFPDGHKGVSIIYSAQYVAGHWVTEWGATTMPGTAIQIGNGTPYVKNPTYTNGESCWTLGSGARYPSSGCDHFGISLAFGKTPGKTTYHWLVPGPQLGKLVKYGTVASLPPSPVLNQLPPAPGAPPVVHAVAQAPEQPERLALNQFSDAYWLKTFTSYSPKHADLNKLQMNLVPMKGPGVVIGWALVQRAPVGVAGEKSDVEDDSIPPGDVQVVKRYEYYTYNGAYDPETHEVNCGGDNSCNVPVLGLNGQFELGKFIGAHMNAYDVR